MEKAELRAIEQLLIMDPVQLGATVLREFLIVIPLQLVAIPITENNTQLQFKTIFEE